MIENNPTNVVAAFEMLLEEIEAEIELVNKVGAKAFEVRDYERARAALEQAGHIIAFRSKVDDVRREWSLLAGQHPEAHETLEDHGGRRNLGRLRRGLRTPEEAYNLPILQALESLGGSAPVGQVVEKVRQLMAGVLREVDFEPLASDPESPRWRNSAQWARNAMAREGLLKNDSPRGIWELSEAGRLALKAQKT
jgi:peptidoglycan/xylan/chitin deacetylase (PgdA/CDA1 family)